LGIGELAIVLETVAEGHELLVSVHEDALELDFVAREAVGVGGAVLHDIPDDLFLAGLRFVGMALLVVVASVAGGGSDVGGLEPANALHSPFGVGHLSDEGVLEGVGGSVLVLEAGEVFVVVGGIFAGDDTDFGEKSVFEAVVRDAVFAFVGAWAGGFLCILSVCLDLFFGCHGSFPLGTSCAPVAKKAGCWARGSVHRVTVTEW